MSKLFTLTIIPKILVEGNVVALVGKKDEERFLRIEATFDDINIKELIEKFLIENVAAPKENIEIVFDKMFLEKDSLIGHIYVLFNVYGYKILELDNTKFELIEEN